MIPLVDIILFPETRVPFSFFFLPLQDKLMNVHTHLASEPTCHASPGVMSPQILRVATWHLPSFMRNNLSKRPQNCISGFLWESESIRTHHSLTACHHHSYGSTEMLQQGNLLRFPAESYSIFRGSRNLRTEHHRAAAVAHIIGHEFSVSSTS
jgi:hypothetical protein